MRLSIFMAALALLAPALPCVAADANDWLIVPGVRVGPVRADTVRGDLQKMFPQAAVQDSELELDEGVVFPSTWVARNTPSESLAIVWNGRDADAHPKEIFVCRGRRRGECKWHVDTGAGNIAVGTRLTELEALNGGPLTVNGFGWTYGGNVISWENGKIAKLDCNGSLSIAIDGERNRDGDLTMQMTDAEAASFEGNRPISSTTPALRKLNPAVNEILFIFPGANAKPCPR